MIFSPKLFVPCSHLLRSHQLSENGGGVRSKNYPRFLLKFLPLRNATYIENPLHTLKVMYSKLQYKLFSKSGSHFLATLGSKVEFKLSFKFHIKLRFQTRIKPTITLNYLSSISTDINSVALITPVVNIIFIVTDAATDSNTICHELTFTPHPKSLPPHRKSPNEWVHLPQAGTDKHTVLLVLDVQTIPAPLSATVFLATEGVITPVPEGATLAPFDEITWRSINNKNIPKNGKKNKMLQNSNLHSFIMSPANLEFESAHFHNNACTVIRTQSSVTKPCSRKTDQIEAREIPHYNNNNNNNNNKKIIIILILIVISSSRKSNVT